MNMKLYDVKVSFLCNAHDEDDALDKLQQLLMDNGFIISTIGSPAKEGMFVMLEAKPNEP